MKAKNLIKILENNIQKYGDDIEVYIEAPGFNCETIYNCKPRVDDYVRVEDLENYPKHLIMESHGKVEGEGPGLIRAVCLLGKNQVDFCG